MIVMAELWGAHAYSVLVIAFRDDELFGKIVSAEYRSQHATNVRFPE
jgi:hypothetical protein